MIVTNILTAICSLLFFMVGVDKFSPIMEPPCSLASILPSAIWKFLGVLQLAGSILIWIPKFRKYVAGFFIAFMLFFSMVHLVNKTYDIGGALSIAFLLGLLLWNPSLRFKKK